MEYRESTRPLRSGSRSVEDIERALAQAGGKITRAAEILGVHRANPVAANANSFPSEKTDEAHSKRVLGNSWSDGQVWTAIRQAILIGLPNDSDRFILEISLR